MAEAPPPLARPQGPKLLCARIVQAQPTPRHAAAAELLVQLPLAYYVPPVSLTPGRLSASLDLEQTR
jgi:hypothetical protein